MKPLDPKNDSLKALLDRHDPAADARQAPPQEWNRIRRALEEKETSRRDTRPFFWKLAAAPVLGTATVAALLFLTLNQGWIDPASPSATDEEIAVLLIDAAAADESGDDAEEEEPFVGSEYLALID